MVIRNSEKTNGERPSGDPNKSGHPVVNRDWRPALFARATNEKHLLRSFGIYGNHRLYELKLDGYRTRAPRAMRKRQRRAPPNQTARQAVERMFHYSQS